MAIQTGLEGKPWYYGAGLGLLLGALLVAGGYYFIFTPQYDQIAAKDKKLAELQVKIQEGRAAKQKLPQFREEVRRLELELDKLLRILPSRRNTPELLRRIRQLTEQGAFDLLRFTPGNFVGSRLLQRVADHHPARRLVPQPRALLRPGEPVLAHHQHREPQGLRAAEEPKGHTISASFVAKTFIYKDPADQPPPPPPAPGKKGKKK